MKSLFNAILLPECITPKGFLDIAERTGLHPDMLASYALEMFVKNPPSHVTIRWEMEQPLKFKKAATK